MVKWGVPEKILQNAVQTRWSQVFLGLPNDHGEKMDYGEDGAGEVDVGEVDGNYDDHVGRDEDDGDCLPQGPD